MPQSPKNDSSEYRTQIIVAIIGVVGVIAAALISRPPMNNQPSANSPTPVFVSLTDTLVPTSIMSSNTVVPPTFTHHPASPTPPGYYEDFNESTNWVSLETPVPSEDGTESRYLLNGAYYWNIQADKNATFSIPIRDLKNPNFEFEVVFQKVETANPKDDYYGVRFRQNSSFAYYFYISNNGTYTLERYSYVEKKWADLVYETQYPIINKNGNNALKVVARGESIHLYINGILVERVLDKSSLAGSFSLWAWLPYPNHEMKIEISQLSIVPLTSSSPLDIWPTQLGEVETAELQLSDVDTEMTIWINGDEIITSKYGDVPTWIPFDQYLISGDNLIEVSVRNGEDGLDCSGELRLRLNGIVNSAYQRFWDNKDASQNSECFRETVVLPLD